MPDDARLLELQVLTELEQTGHYRAGPFDVENQSLRRLLAYLLKSEFADAELVENDAIIRSQGVGVEYQRRMELKKWDYVLDVASGKAISLVPTHAGAARRAELEQQLKTGRIKETFGIIWDGRHFRQDARIALLNSSTQEPLSVAYLDLNDVKGFNEKSHAIGDEAIKRYLEIVADVISERGDGRYGDAYRLSGGADEVVILFARTDNQKCCLCVKSLLKELGQQSIDGITLRAAAGVVTAMSPEESVDDLKARADEQQKRAKEASRTLPGRPSFLAHYGVAPQRI